MKSTNFEFLREKFPNLANLAGFAEAYIYTDPASCLVKLRTYTEQMVQSIFDTCELPRAIQPKLFDLLNDSNFKEVIPPVILNKFHLIRKAGNDAAHTGDGASAEILHLLLQESFDLARWYYLSIGRGQKSEIPNYQVIKKTQAEDEQTESLKRQNKAALAKLAQQEAQMTQLLQELDEARKNKVHPENGNVKQLSALKEVSENAANELQFSEEETCTRLVDVQLREAGWDLNDPLQVKREYPVGDQCTQTGKGRCDYVLFDPHSNSPEVPIAVIEVKAVRFDASKGRNQAKFYADALERKHGFRPVIFYTNGFDIKIWDDHKSKNQPPRSIFGFYSLDSLQYCIHQRTEMLRLVDQKIDHKVIDRDYQIQAVSAVSERFDPSREGLKPHRRALLIQATGTGKTRVSMALCDRMTRAHWVKRILFLCDRKELRKQANGAFKEFLPDMSRVQLNAQTAKERHHSIYLSTYPAMMKRFQSFDVGFFDLIIADESHRSIYNRYRPIFTYFDSYQVGLTATPLQFIFRNTFSMFECEDGNPTYNYDYTTAVEQGHLTDFTLINHSTNFLRKGIKYKDLTPEQRKQLEEQVDNAENFNAEKSQLNKSVFNKDTDRKIIQTLMEKGLKNADGSKLGKTIVFARNHQHAVQIKEVFHELFPQYAYDFCEVIDNYEVRSEQLIDDFKDNTGKKELTIAISVDMLDTGIDVPEVVNLVFNKEVKSFAKFWQMIGRGTRLCKDLFGPGQDKEKFYIFDHWGNFDYFEEGGEEKDPGQVKSLMQKLFEARILLAESAFEKQELNGFKFSIKNIYEDIVSLNDKTIAVREKWQIKKRLENLEVLNNFNKGTVADLYSEIAPLMMWRNLENNERAFHFDLLIAEIQEMVVTKSAATALKTQELVTQVGELPINLSQVTDKIDVINKVKSAEFQKNPTVKDLEFIREELRNIMRFRQRPTVEPKQAIYLDVQEEGEEFTVIAKPKLAGQDLVAYRHDVEKVLSELVANNSVLQKIKRQHPISDQEIKTLDAQVSELDPSIHLEDLPIQFPKAGGIEEAIRQIIGIDQELVDEKFHQFILANPSLSVHQQRFLSMLKNHIAKFGAIEAQGLWEAPFSSIPGGADNFDDYQLDQILEIVATF